MVKTSAGRPLRPPSNPQPKPFALIIVTHTLLLLLLLLLLFLTFSALVANLKKTTLHGGQSRSWSAE